ncbi:hypothetical protein [Bacillus bombysepticus]|uniref:hypothetical protein n=1 Tax=Bacillus bombysepticus TaxID=658666 RepID=UPI00301A2F07
MSAIFFVLGAIGLLCCLAALINVLKTDTDSHERYAEHYEEEYDEYEDEYKGSYENQLENDAIDGNEKYDSYNNSEDMRAMGLMSSSRYEEEDTKMNAKVDTSFDSKYKNLYGFDDEEIPTPLKVNEIGKDELLEHTLNASISEDGLLEQVSNSSKEKDELLEQVLSGSKEEIKEVELNDEKKEYEVEENDTMHVAPMTKVTLGQRGVKTKTLNNEVYAKEEREVYPSFKFDQNAKLEDEEFDKDTKINVKAYEPLVYQKQMMEEEEENRVPTVKERLERLRSN